MVNPPDWAMVEQDPTGLWWITTDATIGPYLDEIQALRALRAQPDPPSTVVVVHTTNPGRRALTDAEGGP